MPASHKVGQIRREDTRLASKAWHPGETPEGRWARRDLIEVIGDEATAVGGVIEHVLHHFATRHGALASANEREADQFIQCAIAGRIA